MVIMSKLPTVVAIVIMNRLNKNESNGHMNRLPTVVAVVIMNRLNKSKSTGHNE